MKKLLILMLGLSVTTPAVARDQLHIVGSSTVYPFASFVAEEFGSVSRYRTPIVESTGTGGGMKIFCEGNEMSTPDIVTASRRMKIMEYNVCARNGVKDMTEVLFGHDGIVIAQSKSHATFDLSKRELLLAVAKLVPNKDETQLVENPYTRWNQINPALPDRKIVIYGPPVSSGTRDAVEEIVMQYPTEQMKVYRDSGNKGYRIVRTDGVYIPSGENDNLIVQKLTKDQDAIGIFGYSFLAENTDTLNAVDIDGVSPSIDSIKTLEYPISRSLYFYVKNSHINQVEGMKEFMDMFIDEEIVGSDGLLSEMGLIPLTEEVYNASKTALSNQVQLGLEQLEAAAN